MQEQIGTIFLTLFLCKEPIKCKSTSGFICKISENLEQTAYSKTILKKKKESGFDLKEALTPTEDLIDIMKAFNIEDD